VSPITLSLALNKVSMVHFAEIPFSKTRLLENIYVERNSYTFKKKISEGGEVYKRCSVGTSILLEVSVVNG